MKFFTKNCNKFIAILLILFMILAMSSEVFATYTDSLKTGNKLKFTGNSWCVYKTQTAAKNFDTSKIKRYLSKNATVTIKSKNGNVLEIGSNEYIYYGSTASKYFSKINTTQSSSTTTSSSNVQTSSTKTSSSNTSSNKKSLLSTFISNLSKRAEQRKALVKSFSNLLDNLFSATAQKTSVSSNTSTNSSQASSQPIVANNTVTIPSETGAGYKFYYNNLSDKCKKVYRYLYSKKSDFIKGNNIDLNNLKNTVGNSLTPSEVYSATGALEKDFPEFQYILTCNKIVCYKTSGDQATRLAFSKIDSSLQNNLDSIDKIANNLVNNTNGKSNYDKLKYLNDYICNNMTYKTGVSLSIDGFTTKKGQCMTYAMMYKYLLNKLNVDCICVTGKAPTSNSSLGAHAWNYVKVNGNWYGVDVCWNDTASSKGISYKYFLKGKSTFSNRTLDNSAYPTLCSSNY